MPDWNAVREEFPSLREWTYLNTATFGQLPHCATEAAAQHFARRDEYACSDFLEWFDDMDGVRESLARLIHCQASDIAFFTNAATPVSLLANAIPWRPGDRILTLEHEFPNHLYLAQAFPGVEADIVPWERFPDAITDRTRLVMLSTVNYSTGLRPPLGEVAARCRKQGALLSIDGTQSLGALRFDIRELDPDLFAVDGYKWLLCPNGASFAYIHPRVREWLKPGVIGWRSDRRWREVNALHHGAAELKTEAERYEGGMVPFASLYGMGASVDLMLQLGPKAIEERVLALAAYARTRLRSTKAQLLADTSPLYEGAIIAARWPGADSVQLARDLKQRRILVAARHGNLRISTHFYNNERDVEALVEALHELLS